jgi:hypothetical protein
MVEKRRGRVFKAEHESPLNQEENIGGVSPSLALLDHVLMTII